MHSRLLREHRAGVIPQAVSARDTGEPEAEPSKVMSVMPVGHSGAVASTGYSDRE
jgi:hypothetical protein